MGVKDLWKALDPGIDPNSLRTISLEAFEKRREVRGLRLGCEAERWLLDSNALPQHGTHNSLKTEARENFYRLLKLLRTGPLLLFVVFNGRGKPEKLGKAAGASVERQRMLKELLEMLSIPWRVAPGEATAELAACAKRGEIDAVLSESADTLLFGAPVVIRHNPPSHSPSQSQLAAAAPPTPSPSPPTKIEPKDLYLEYDQDVVEVETGLGVSDLILCALLFGGDYAKGIEGFGMDTARALAQCAPGFGTELLEGIEAHKGDERRTATFMRDWRNKVAEELRTNSQGKLGSRRPRLAQTLEAVLEFPDLKVVSYYTHPLISSSLPPPTWNADINLAELIPYLSATFAWSHPEIRLSCRNLLYPILAMQELRSSALLLNSPVPHPHPVPAPTSSSSFHSISDLKTSAATDGAPSYRVQLSATHFDDLIAPHLPMPDPFARSSSAKKLAKSKGVAGAGVWRHWLPKTMVEMDEGGKKLVNDWGKKQEAKEARLARRKGPSSDGGPAGARSEKSGGAMLESRKGKGRAVDSDAISSSTEDEEDPLRPNPSPTPLASQINSRTHSPPTLPLRRRRSSTPGSTSSDDDEHTPPPSKSPRRTLQQHSPVKPSHTPQDPHRRSLESHQHYIELSSDEEEEHLPSPNHLGRPSPSASPSSTAAAFKSSTFRTHISTSPAPSSNAPNRRLLAPLTDDSSSLKGKASSRIASRTGILSFSSSKSGANKIHRTSSTERGGMSLKTSQPGRAIFIGSSTEEAEDEEMLLPLDEALEERRESRETLTNSGGAEGKGKGKKKTAAGWAPKGKGKEREMVEELVLSDLD